MAAEWMLLAAALALTVSERALCSRRVMFAGHGMSVTLPPLEDVAVDLPAGEARGNAFTREREMLHGQVVVDSEEVTG